jgi:hypothetical protein
MADEQDAQGDRITEENILDIIGPPAQGASPLDIYFSCDELAPAKRQALSEHLARLKTVAWFSEIGKPIPEPPGTPRIYDWDDWHAYDRNVEEVAWRGQALYDEIINGADNPELLRRLWDLIAEEMPVPAAIPYDPSQIPEHAPTMAVGHATWTAGLIGLCLASGRPIPEDLERQWQWFLRGHWPCSCQGITDDGRLGPLVVF